jgi:hypothetical protein
MTDAYTKGVIHGCGVEIKPSGGDYDEAVVQLGIWCAAGLRQRQSLRPAVVSASLQPLVGWTVVGHEWKLHLSWRDDQTGEVVSRLFPFYTRVD